MNIVQIYGKCLQWETEVSQLVLYCVESFMNSSRIMNLLANYSYFTVFKFLIANVRIPFVVQGCNKMTFMSSWK